MDSSRDLTGPMLKTKFLAHKIGNSELLEWVNKELNGYKNADDLPDYRNVRVTTTMSFVVGDIKWSGQPIPTAGMSDAAKRLLSEGYFLESVATLSTFSSNDADDRLAFNIPAELVRYVEIHIKELGHNPYFNIVSIRKEASFSAAVQTLAVIRSRLLDFMLEIEEELGSETTIESLRAANRQITTIMYNTITNTGDGNVINSGDQAQVNASISINRGDIQGLVNKLTELKVSEPDQAELISALAIETTDPDTNLFGPRVNEWITRMLGKALNGSWQIGAGAAGGVLTELVKAYYGIGK
ncbi:hypothetical protein F7231_04355 [Fibrella aestuarina]|uniref:AbiTii domain-containing protein n=2 Tax=Fibrivirga algicola TaxID=2950420 RepID=A0ABX0QEI9_9BACT|nr:hypothetical protein [Fibrivirga algicola]